MKFFYKFKEIKQLLSQWNFSLKSKFDQFESEFENGEFYH